jgi:hypothetical protein
MLGWSCGTIDFGKWILPNLENFGVIGVNRRTRERLGGNSCSSGALSWCACFGRRRKEKKEEEKRKKERKKRGKNGKKKEIWILFML